MDHGDIVDGVGMLVQPHDMPDGVNYPMPTRPKSILHPSQIGSMSVPIVDGDDPGHGEQVEITVYKEST